MATLKTIGDIVVEVQYALYRVKQTTKVLVGIFNTYEKAVIYAEQNDIDVHFGNGTIDEYSPNEVNLN